MTLTIGSLAQRAGVGVDTVRFYERAGLLPRPARSASGYRLYVAADVDRLRFIRRAKALGFALEEIAELLQLAAGKGSRAAVRALAEKRLAGLEQRICELTAMRDALAGHARKCCGDGPVEGCPIIEAVLAAPTPAACERPDHRHDAPAPPQPVRRAAPSRRKTGN